MFREIRAAIVPGDSYALASDPNRRKQDIFGSLAGNPDATKQGKPPNAAQGNNMMAVQLDIGSMLDGRQAREMGVTALHWIGFNGNAEMTRELLSFHPDLELKCGHIPELPCHGLCWRLEIVGIGIPGILSERFARFWRPVRLCPRLGSTGTE
jgi:hypothetical protein